MRTSANAAEDRQGVDADKKIKGRKRHVATDTLRSYGCTTWRRPATSRSPRRWNPHQLLRAALHRARDRTCRRGRAAPARHRTPPAQPGDAQPPGLVPGRSQTGGRPGKARGPGSCGSGPSPAVAGTRLPLQTGCQAVRRQRQRGVPAAGTLVVESGGPAAVGTARRRPTRIADNSFGPVRTLAAPGAGRRRHRVDGRLESALGGFRQGGTAGLQGAPLRTGPADGYRRSPLGHRSHVRVCLSAPTRRVDHRAVLRPTVVRGAGHYGVGKRHRAVATRYDKLAVRYEATVLTAAIDERL